MPSAEQLRAAAEVLVFLELTVIGILWGLYQKTLYDYKLAQEQEMARVQEAQATCKACMAQFLSQNAELAKAAIKGLEQNSAALITLKNDLHLYEALSKLGKKKAEGAV